MTNLFRLLCSYLTYDGQMIQRLSNVYFNSHVNAQQEEEGEFVTNLDIYAAEKINPPAIEDQEGPALIYMAAGLWFTNDKNGSMTVPWEPRFENHQNRFNDIFKFIIDNAPEIHPFTAPMDPYDGIGNQIFYGPASGPCYQGNISGSIEASNCKASEVIEMHNWLHGTSNSLLPESNPLPLSEKLAHQDQDGPFLSGNQTEEWKGWMLCFIMVYRWTETSKASISIYILFRLCVAAHLFQTGYGHTHYFIRTDDFSFARVAAILLRLNTLACALAYFMNTDYMFYHAASCASLWFLVVYATMAIRKQYNSKLQLLLTKVLVSGTVISLVLSSFFMK
uniref:WGS project CBMI000000000 data, contig CS3069_c004964 n=1 Tax=Fusarium clavum TaxID=2594811 RepID=A0A090N657_9HYPO|nr:unnamed protein product [Fusarium clavum]